MKDKFLDMIEEQLAILNEQEPPPPPDPAGDPAAAPADAPAAEAPQTALPDEDSGEDDLTKLKMDYVDMIRKALIMNSDHVSDIDMARLSKKTDLENLDMHHELVRRIVNEYPEM